MKKAFALFLALCMMFALCACGQTEAPAQPETPAEPQTETPAEAPAETTGWAPNGPVTMIVAYKAGNGTDVTARILAQYAEKYVGQTIVIENVDGGSGSIGWSQIAAAAPDGMTIGFMNLPNFNSSIVKGLGTYTTADFAAICNHVTETSLVLVRADDERFNDIDDLVAYAKENQTVASTNGAQASNHIGAQAFANSAGFKYIDLPQGNTADELTSLLGKEAELVRCEGCRYRRPHRRKAACRVSPPSVFSSSPTSRLSARKATMTSGSAPPLRRRSRRREPGSHRVLRGRFQGDHGRSRLSRGCRLLRYRL